ncbi:MAG: hypothetical protein ACOZIN_17275 [Myxococcota bacterium]
MSTNVARKMGEPAASVAEAPKSDLFPKGIPYIVGNEGAERFSFYGMKAILKVYLIGLYLKLINAGLTEATATADQMAAARAESTEVVHLFVAGVYAFPLIGAIISDRLLGKYRVIFWVSLIYCAGHAVLAIAGRLDALQNFSAAQWGMYIGLGLIAVGSGGIKPCVSANVGDQFTAENGHLVTKVFQIFYFIINYGSFFSTLLTPLLLMWFGPEVAFGVPGVLMALATLVFWMGRNKFVKVPPKPGGPLGLLDTFVTMLLLSPLLVVAFGGILPAVADFVWMTPEALAAELAKNPRHPATLGAVLLQFWPHFLGAAVAFGLGFVLFFLRQARQPDAGFMAVLIYNLTHQKERKPGQSFFDVGRAKYGEEAGDGPPAVLKIMLVFSMVSVFWALFDQHASTWIDQAKMMRLGITVPAYLGYWTVVATLALSFYAGIWLFTWVSNIRIPRKMTWGVLGVAAASGVVCGLLDLAGPAIGTVGTDGERARMLSFALDPAQLSALNPLMVMAIIPLLNVAVYEPFKKAGREIKPLVKMTVGMFLASVAFVSAALMQKMIENNAAGSSEQLHGLWQALPYFLMTVAEVLVSITGLEFAYTQAPRAMKSTIMSFWLLCVTFGNLLVAFLAPLQKTLALSSFFWVFAGLMAGAALVFAVLGHFYRGKTYLQQAASH